ncbi:MAG: TRAP transporter large permease [Pigmentiphaga sp.]|nr:TRAP transporter large permease [Pigmentiphaga sp.]
MTLALLAFLAAFALIFFQVPIALGLGFVGLMGYILLNDTTAAISMVMAVTRDVTMSYPLIVLPLFILMGNLVAGSGVSYDLFRAAQAVLGRRKGGVAMATVLTAGGFSAICGSSVATAATVGRVAIPDMRRLGYSDGLSSASVAAGGTLGILIPPSVLLVVYGVATQTHIGMLFAAGMIPGLVGVLGYFIAVKWTIWRKPDSAPAVMESDPTPKARLILSLWPVLAIFGLVMSGIYSGWFTTVEASGIGAAASLVYALSRHSVRGPQLYHILVDTAKTSCMMFAIILGAAIFGELINQTGIHHALMAMVNADGMSPFWVITIMLLIYLVIGCVLESLSILLLTIPIFFPVIVALGFDPVWFGIVVVVVVEIGLITPPIGVNLFVIRSVVPDIPMSRIVLGVIPFVVVDLFRLALVALVPALSLWLPYALFPGGQ